MSKVSVEVKDSTSDSRFEAYVDGAVAGFVEYETDGDVLTLVHTEVDDAFEGKGVGSTLVRATLDDVLVRDGVHVHVTCPFIRTWLRKHPDYLHRVHS